MDLPGDDKLRRFRAGYFVPVELQRLGFQNNPIFSELADRGMKPVPGGFQQVQPWCRWRGISTFLDCVAYACRSSKAIPHGSELTLEHITPGQFYSASIIFFTQALLDNIGVWLCDALPLSVKGGERHFLSTQFKREPLKREPTAKDVLGTHESFVKRINQYRQVWAHTLAGGSMPLADESPFENPETTSKFLGVPIDPAIHLDEPNYRRRIEQCALGNDGRYLYELTEFTTMIL